MNLHMIKYRIRFQYLLLLVFPAAFLILQILLKLDYKYFYLSSHDPAYGYLFNGLNLAQGNMQLGLSAHPGSPLHCLIALNILVINLFSGGLRLPDSVLSNPEYFLNIISYEIVVLNTVVLALLGLWTYRKINNLPLSLALQLTPFVSLQGFSFASMVMLEPLLLCIEMLLMMLLAAYAFGQQKPLGGRNLFPIAMLAALAVATKIVAIPLLFLPFFAIEGARNRRMYTGITIVSLMVFLIPIYEVFPSFLNWIRALFMHTGKYGSGNPGIIDLPILKENIRSIFSASYIFTTGFLLVMIASVVSLLPWFKPQIAHHKRNMVLGLAMVFILNGVMVAKHYSNHYLLISYNLIVFGLLLSLSIFSDLKSLKQRVIYAVRFKTALVLLAGTALLLSLVSGIHFSPSFRNPRLNALAFVEKNVKNTQRIIVLENSCPFIETALYHGLAYSGGMRARYAGFLKKKYPDSYFYNFHQDVFHDWINEFNAVDLLSGSKKTYLYYASKKDTFPPVLLARLNKMIHNKEILSLKTSYKNPAVREYIYEIDVNVHAMAAKIMHPKGVFCNFEDIASDTAYFNAPDSLYKFNRTSLRSTDDAYSGRFSIKLDKENPYGPGTKIVLQRGYYEITVMRHSDDGNGFIVAADKTGTAFYKANAIAKSALNGWESLGLTVDIPEDMEGQEISVYLWYPGKSTCFFDDLKITWYEIL